MSERFSRTQLLYGEDAMKYFASCRIAVFGVGGVGGYVVEALARSGIGALDLIDNDRVCLSNINRQIIATTKTVGRYKVNVAEERVKEINPDCAVRTYRMFFLPETADQFDFRDYDYVVDAIDTVSGKLAIVEKAKAQGIPVISAMGAGNKVNPAAFEVADIYETSVCPLAKVMRKECRKRGIESLKVVYSKEESKQPLACVPVEDGSADSAAAEDRNTNCVECVRQADNKRTDSVSEKEMTISAEQAGSRRRSIPGSTAFAPSVAGLIIAGEIINDLAARSSMT